MRKVKLYIATSLDAYIAGPNGEIDWLMDDADYHYCEFIDSIGVNIMGRKTYDFLAAYEGEWPYPKQDTYIFSRNTPDPGDSRVIWSHEDPAEFTRNLQKEEGPDIWLIGGGEINTILLEANLIDEMLIFMHPIVLGEGLPLFGGKPARKDFELTYIHAYENGVVELRYSRK